MKFSRIGPTPPPPIEFRLEGTKHEIAVIRRALEVYVNHEPPYSQMYTGTAKEIQRTIEADFYDYR